MVWSRDGEAERPPLSVILPQLYLGAESDVTQDRLASHGISHVLSVSRCSPQPSFLPHSRYLRIPIDDSLWDDLLPWIPQALHFIDAAMSSGGSVLVHCAAGISRSPALAVAYIMYNLGMDLDQAYRYVKERRPSISPNFNFLGQLQHFQSALDQKASCGISTLQQLKVAPPSIIEGIKTSRQIDPVTSNTAEVTRPNKEVVCSTDNEKYRHKLSDGNRNICLSPSTNLQTLTLNNNEQQVQTACAGTTPSSFEQGRAAESLRRPRNLRLQSDSASLAEKRKSLTLSLTPLGINDQPVHSDKTRGERQAAALSSPTPCGQRVSNRRCNRDDAPEQGALLSPFSFTLNKLLDWGERVLLGGMFVQPVRMGQAALHYR